MRVYSSWAQVSAASSVRCLLTGKRKLGRAAACAAALTVVAGLAAGCSSSTSSSAVSGGIGLDSSSLPTNFGPPEETTVKVGAVPAMDSAGFMVALHEGLFAKEGLNVI